MSGLNVQIISGQLKVFTGHAAGNAAAARPSSDLITDMSWK